MSEKRKDKKGRILRTGEGQRQDGRYYFRWMTPDGKRHTKYADTLNELRDKEKEIERRRLLGTDTVNNIEPNIVIKSDAKQEVKIPKTQVTVEQLLLKYIESRNDVRTNTKLNYQYCYKIIQRDTGNWILGMQANELKLSEAKKWYGEFYTRNTYCNETFSKVKTIFKKAFEYGQNEGILTRNPFAFDFRLDVPPQSRNALTPAQQEKLFAFLDSDKCSVRHRNTVVVLLETGLRISEFCGLAVDDIDFGTSTLQVKRQIMYRKIGDKYRSYVQVPKTTAGYRTIPLSPSAVQALHNLIARADLSVKVDGVSGLVMAKNGSECRADSIQKHLRVIIRRLQKHDPSFPYTTPHVLRHTFCTNLFRLGVNPKAIQKIMGHTNISTTLDVYTHMEDEAIRSQIDELGDSISFAGTRHSANGALPNKKSKEVDDVQSTPSRTPFTPYFTPFASRDMDENGGMR